MNYLNPDRAIQRNGEDPPHWQQGAALQFVTFRLGDALPLSLIRDWRKEKVQWLAENPQPWSRETGAEYHRRFSAKFERWLDQGMGSCLFADPAAREVLRECLMRFDGERVHHEAWVIMPNHVHALFRPLVPMEKLIQAWKGHSARVLGKGSIWQRNYRARLPLARGQHPDPRRAPAQPEEHRRRYSARETRRHHRTERFREILAGLSHALCRGPAALCGKPLGLCAAVSRPIRKTRRRFHRRPQPGDRHRTARRRAQPALDGGHRDRDPRLPARVVGGGRRAA
jgi:putative transposase